MFRFRLLSTLLSLAFFFVAHFFRHFCRPNSNQMPPKGKEEEEEEEREEGQV
jgi:hypothetical protein